MAKLVSRIAFVVTIGYAALVAVLLVAAWHVSDLEGRAFDLLFIGLPWVLAIRNDSALLYLFAVMMNVATVYMLVLALVKVFSSRD
jgi:hypothetical protein